MNSDLLLKCVDELDKIMKAVDDFNELTDGKYLGFDNGKTEGKTLEDIIEAVVYLRHKIEE